MLPLKLCTESTHSSYFATDMYEDDEETLPEEIQRYWACWRAWAHLYEVITYIKACKSQQGKSLPNLLFAAGVFLLHPPGWQVIFMVL